jgi:hypothetical protein
MNKLYHSEVYFEDWFKDVAVDLFNTNYSKHLCDHFMYDNNKKRYGMTKERLTAIINQLIKGERDFYLYEVEIQEPKFMVKAVVRASYDKDYDVSIVFAFYENCGEIVKTAWLNEKTDTHTTLDASKYYKP